MAIIFVTGGVRSGKSRFACELARKRRGQVAYIATAEAKDREMQKRIQIHRANRPKEWKLIEEPHEVDEAVRKAAGCDCIIVDCLTLLITNWLLGGPGWKKGEPSEGILRRFSGFMKKLKKLSATIIIVSNEVGMGIVPQKKLGRIFRDICGEVNQMVGEQADEVYFLVSGIPLKLKGKG